ncbi:D-alanyl-D-alanine carboxypeptidase family protein [Oribacterium sp. WCC10]|uniref:D-alanyl-D-alanine carboxypeptidase family protein n=1 Tax=Oribacterium sp. WCC10 TaxID=1855343 RepID=UPI0008E4872D|nr:D-alanyl-D-alanine carboxypeptidase family protein [Oribacterium sp. WCC10]SFG31591.1 D-alanyl-D-alanine carboxypeptidase [Oribacterium sp. WCC10]
MTEKNHGQLRFLTTVVAMTILIVSMLCPFMATTAYAAWNFPTVELTAEAGIVMDADTGAILFQKNPHQREYPASITKVLTALVVLDNCELGDLVTFSHDDVYNVDVGSSNAQIDEGDVLTVEDCLNALLLKSANEAANALACHVAGSREAFAEMMNEKARSLGCTDSNFTNPSGLFNENHYTSAADMALIGIAAMKNEKFMEIDSHLSYKLAGTVRNPDGHTVYMEHKMLRNDTQYSDKRVVAGKTGYTKDSGNTLITMASENGRNLVAVVLKDKNPAHYTDTKALLDLGFYSTEKQLLNDGIFNTEDIKNRLIADTVVDDKCQASDISVKEDMYVSLPVGSTQDGLTYRLNYNLPTKKTANTVAEIEYLADGLTVGRYNVEKEQSVEIATTAEETVPEEIKETVGTTSVNMAVIAGVVAAAIVGTGTFLIMRRVKDQHRLERHMRERRSERLKDLNVSEDEFREMLEKRRAVKTHSQNSPFVFTQHENGHDHPGKRVQNRRNVSRGRREQRQ